MAGRKLTCCGCVDSVMQWHDGMAGAMCRAFPRVYWRSQPRRWVTSVAWSIHAIWWNLVRYHLCTLQQCSVTEVRFILSLFLLGCVQQLCILTIKRWLKPVEHALRFVGSCPGYITVACKLRNWLVLCFHCLTYNRQTDTRLMSSFPGQPG